MSRPRLRGSRSRTRTRTRSSSTGALTIPWGATVVLYGRAVQQEGSGGWAIGRYETDASVPAAAGRKATLSSDLARRYPIEVFTRKIIQIPKGRLYATLAMMTEA